MVDNIVKVRHVNASQTDKVDTKDMMPKRGGHMTPADAMNQSMQKPASVKPGFGHNTYSSGKDTTPGFEGLETYKSTVSPGVGAGQGVYPMANKKSGPSSGD